MKKRDFNDRIFLGITAKNGRGWKRKIKKLKKYKITKAALFLEELLPKKRAKLYKYLLKSNITEIPLVHIRGDITRDEIEFLIKNFNSKYFTIHESDFKILDKWNGLHKKLYLEMNFDDFVSKTVRVEKIGGFCVDLSHFKAAQELSTKEFKYVDKREKTKRYFKCNHLNGYSYKEKRDLHRVRHLDSFDYLKTLPKFLFGDIIALEVYNPIKQQIKFKEYLSKLLNRHLNEKSFKA